MESYFVKIYVKQKGNRIPVVKNIICFFEIEELFEWMQDNRNELFCVYGANVILDYS